MLEEAPNKIQFLQWNCQSIKLKLPELQRRANQYIIFLSETWLTKEDTVYIKDFDIIRKYRGGCTRGGVAIIF
jgi:hypothetical protein